MNHTPIKRITTLIGVTLLSGCTLNPVKHSTSAAPATQVDVYDAEKKTTLSMFVFGKTPLEKQTEHMGYIVEFEPKVTENADNTRSVLIYKD